MPRYCVVFRFFAVEKVQIDFIVFIFGEDRAEFDAVEHFFCVCRFQGRYRAFFVSKRIAECVAKRVFARACHVLRVNVAGNAVFRTDKFINRAVYGGGNDGFAVFVFPYVCAVCGIVGSGVRDRLHRYDRISRGGIFREFVSDALCAVGKGD